MANKRFLVAAVVLVAACGGGGDGYGGGGGPTGPNNPGGGSFSGTIQILSGSFSPDSVNITPGTTVTFANNNTGVHDVVFSGNVPSGGNIPQHSSGSNQRTFSSAGRSGILCTVHGFTGVIRVQ